MNVRDCMTAQPITAQANEPIQRAAKMMQECDIGCLPILNDDRLVGLVTDRDIVVRAVAGGLDLANHQVQEIMSRDIKTTTADTSIENAAQTMAAAKVRRLPVTEDSKLIGWLSLGDVAVASRGHEELCGSILENVSEPIGPKCVL